jgi:hypothetical protein
VSASDFASASARHASRRSSPRWNVERWVWSISTPRPRVDTSHGIGKLVVAGPLGKVKSGISGRSSGSADPEEKGPSSAQLNTLRPVWSTALERSPKPR